MLLGIIYLFSPLSKEISLSEIQGRVRQFQWKFQLGYYFSKSFHCSNELLLDLEELDDNGLLQEYTCGYDSYLSERYFKLTNLGIGQGKKIVSRFSIDLLEYLEYIFESSARR